MFARRDAKSPASSLGASKRAVGGRHEGIGSRRRLAQAQQKRSRPEGRLPFAVRSGGWLRRRSRHRPGTGPNRRSPGPLCLLALRIRHLDAVESAREVETISWCCQRANRCMAAESISCTTPRPQRSTSEPVTNTSTQSRISEASQYCRRHRYWCRTSRRRRAELAGRQQRIGRYTDPTRQRSWWRRSGSRSSARRASRTRCRSLGLLMLTTSWKGPSIGQEAGEKKLKPPPVSSCVYWAKIPRPDGLCMMLPPI